MSWWQLKLLFVEDYCCGDKTGETESGDNDNIDSGGDDIQDHSFHPL